jgi:integrase
VFWHETRHCGRYSLVRAEKLMVSVLRRSGLKPASGYSGPRIHDMRHAFAVHRLLAWYREGVDPEARRPYLVTYLGHKSIHSTLIYLTITQEPLHVAGERYRAAGGVSTTISLDVRRALYDQVR